MSDYIRLMQTSDSEARSNFDFDPRVAFQSTSLPVEMTRPANMGATYNQTLMDPIAFEGVPEGSHSDSNITQQAPTMQNVKRYVIVDAAERDWTAYPNPYSNLTFAFGNQALDRPTPPVYTNQATYPSFALPPTANPLFTPTPGASNLRGFSYVTPLGSQVNLPPYNPSLPRGNFIAYDTSLNVQNNAVAFGSPSTPSNVGSIRLVRAILPQTPFVSYPTDPVINADLSDSKNTVRASPYYTFATYPYLLFFLNDYRGQYYGPSEMARRSFAVLTQCNRTQIDFGLSNGPQYFDYTPWNNEALRFQSPLTNLQKLQITVTDAQGTPFAVSQTDSLTVNTIRLAVNLSDQVSRATLQCIAPEYRTYVETQLRVGDRVTFHAPTLERIIRSDALQQNPSKKAFAQALIGRSFPVLSVKKFIFDGATNQYVPDTGQITTTDSVVDYFNVFYIPNFTTQDNNGVLTDVYPGAVDPGSYELLSVDSILGVGNTLPILNVTQQPVYTFELEVLTPDTTNIGGTVVF